MPDDLDPTCTTEVCIMYTYPITLFMPDDLDSTCTTEVCIVYTYPITLFMPDDLFIVGV